MTSITNSCQFRISWFIQNLSSLFFNELRDGALTTSDDRLFHMLTILQLKKFFLESWHLVFASLRELILVECNDWYVPSSKEQLLSYIPSWIILLTRFVALIWTYFKHFMSPFLFGFRSTPAYSIRNRSIDLYSIKNHQWKGYQSYV